MVLAYERTRRHRIDRRLRCYRFRRQTQQRASCYNAISWSVQNFLQLFGRDFLTLARDVAVGLEQARPAAVFVLAQHHSVKRVFALASDHLETYRSHLPRRCRECFVKTPRSIKYDLEI